jgi:ribonuclease J
MNNVVLRDRKLLARDGIVIVVLTRDKKTGHFIGTPQMVSSGFVDAEEHSEVLGDAVQAVVDSLDHGSEQLLERGLITSKVKDIVGKSLHQRTGSRPMIIPVVLEV